jgi:ribulose-phosphate 3-epimerase
MRGLNFRNFFSFLFPTPRGIVVPAINAESFPIAAEKFRTLEAYGVLSAHIDVADGKFCSAKLFATPEDALQFSDFSKKFSLEAHCMVSNPAPFVDAWFRAGAKRVFLHAEMMNLTPFTDFFFAMKKKYPEKEIGVALLPETDAEFAIPYIAVCGLALVLAVSPGFSGQIFQEHTIEKIAEIRRAVPSAIIVVDGGLNEETGPRVLKTGADELISASFLFSGDFKSRSRALQGLE